MAITDELREYVIDADGMGMTHGHAKSIYAIADRIDAEHEADVSTACRLAAGLDNDALSKRGYIALPVDADGVPIRVGDEMENIVCPSVHREVTGVGVECFYGFDEGNGRYSQFGANCYRHYHALTVEDVLREFLDEAEHFHSLEEERDAISEYAAKLRLAGDAE